MEFVFEEGAVKCFLHFVFIGRGLLPVGEVHDVDDLVDVVDDVLDDDGCVFVLGYCHSNCRQLVGDLSGNIFAYGKSFIMEFGHVVQ